MFEHLIAHCSGFFPEFPRIFYSIASHPITDIKLNQCLQTLDTLNRNAILMAYYYGYSREDIAIHVEQPINTVKSWLKRGLTRLAQCLGH